MSLVKLIRARRSVARVGIAVLGAGGLLAAFANPAGAGYGGVQAAAGSGNRWVGLTHVAATIGGTNWYTPTSGTCTHAYPYNDMYRNNVSGFDSFSFDAPSSGSNCNRVALYLNGTQGGGGAENCYRWQGTCSFSNKTFYSISWHNS